VILAHHGAELPAALATLGGASAIPPLLLLARARFNAARGRLRRRKREE
jgi:hypothetical protein